MAENILDGKGRGYLAEVDSDQRLITYGTATNLEYYLSKNKETNFGFSTRSMTLNSTNNHLVYYIKNTSSEKDLHFSSIAWSWNGGTVNRNKILICEFVPGLSEPTANYTAINASNMNFGSSNSADCDLYTWDKTATDGMTYSGGNIGGTFFIKEGVTELTFQSLILQRNDTLGFLVKGEEIGDFAISVRIIYI